MQTIACIDEAIAAGSRASISMRDKMQERASRVAM
jgi:hypothetical protein